MRRRLNPHPIVPADEPESAPDPAPPGDPAAVIARLEPLVLERRVERLRQVLARRTAQVAFVFEGMTDPHNLSAALRSLEAFGFQDVHLVSPGDSVRLSRKITQGTERWLSVTEHESLEACVDSLKRGGYRVLASHVTADEGEAMPEPLGALDLARPTALLFGNEHAGVSEAARALADGTFRIEMLGFVESLNLSVACAISAFHARARLDRLAEDADDPMRFALPEARRQALYAQWLRQSVRSAERILRGDGKR